MNKSERQAVERELVNLVLANNLPVQAIFRGNSPDDGEDGSNGSTLNYWLVMPGKYNLALEDEITEIDLELSRKARGYFLVSSFPGDVESARNQGYTGVQIWPERQ